jgi:dienelactone hydrolase
MPLQRVSFMVPTGELEGVLHLPDIAAIGGCAVLHGYGGHPEQPHIVATCAALAEAGIAALRFAYRDSQPPKMTLESALADTAGAIRLLKAHPDIPERLGVVGFSFGGTVAAVTAGRDARMRAAVLAAAPAMAQPHFSAWTNDGKWKPVAELSRSRARVLLIWGSRDTQVPIDNAERYRAVLLQARVTNRLVIIEGGDHDFEPAKARAQMTATVADWVRESFTETPQRG